jgi:hypothetical protein
VRATITFIAIYRGSTVSAAKLVALSADPELVEEFVMKFHPTDPADRPPEAAKLRSDGIIGEKWDPRPISEYESRSSKVKGDPARRI